MPFDWREYLELADSCRGNPGLAFHRKRRHEQRSAGPTTVPTAMPCYMHTTSWDSCRAVGRRNALRTTAAFGHTCANVADIELPTRLMFCGMHAIFPITRTIH